MTDNIPIQKESTNFSGTVIYIDWDDTLFPLH